MIVSSNRSHQAPQTAQLLKVSETSIDVKEVYRTIEVIFTDFKSCKNTICDWFVYFFGSQTS